MSRSKRLMKKSDLQKAITNRKQKGRSKAKAECRAKFGESRKEDSERRRHVSEGVTSSTST